MTTRWTTAATALVIVAGCAEHTLYAVSGQSFPRDLNLAYRPLPIAYDQLGNGFWAALGHTLVQPGGWYNGLLASWLHLVGPSGVCFELFMVPWFGLLLLATALLTRAWRDDVTALAATSIVAQMPVLLLSSRLGWVHIPETALVLLATWVLTVDGAISRWSTSILLGIAGFLVITLRPSGLLWMGIVGAVGALSAISAALRRRRQDNAPSGGPTTPLRVLRPALVAAFWGVAALVPLPLLRGYTAGKLGLHDRYANAVPPLLPQLVDHLGGFLLICAVMSVVLGLGRAVVSGKGKGPATSQFGMVGTLTLWAVASLLMYAVVRCGLDNFPLLYVGTAIAVGAALRFAHPVVALVPVAGWLVLAGARTLEELGPSPPLPSSRVTALLDATCPDRGPKQRCVVVTDQGLFTPRSEEPGELELFLMRESSVVLLTVHQRQAMVLKPAALATWSCGAAQDAIWRQRSPRGEQERDAIIARWALTATTKLGAEGCTFSWWTPPRE